MIALFWGGKYDYVLLSSGINKGINIHHELVAGNERFCTALPLF